MISVRKPVICTDYNIPNKKDLAMRFGEDMPDSRLTEPSDGKVFMLREAILLSKRLGRSLTKEEMKKFTI